MIKIILFILIISSSIAHAASQRDVEGALSVYKERCMSGVAHLVTRKKQSFVTINNIECSHYTVSLTISTYLDKGYDSNKATLVLSRNYTNKTLSSLLKRPPKVSLYKRYRHITKGKKVDALNRKAYKKLMRYIHKKRVPYSTHLTEDLKHINKKQGLVITQTIEVNFNELDKAFKFVEHVASKFYKSPVSTMTVFL